MGFLHDVFGISTSSKPHVSKKEYGKAKTELYLEGFNKRKRAKVDEIFAPDFNMPVTESHPSGLEQTEIDARIKYMREHKNQHGFSDHEIDEIETAFKKRL